MPASNEPEKYSIDEMMDRLKNRPSEEPLEDGELVTRADGTRAIRVRKRKRRSQQPQKEMRQRHRRLRIFQLSAVLLLILALVSLIVSAIFYSNSAPFREKVVRMIAESTGAEVELEEFRVNPSRAVAGRLILNWPDDNLLHQMRVHGVSAAVSPSFFTGGSIHGEEVFLRDVEVLLGIPKPAPTPDLKTADKRPSPVSFTRYSISRLKLGSGDLEKPVYNLVDSEASYLPEAEKGRPQLLLNRGRVQFQGWPAMRLDRAHIEFRRQEIDVITLNLLHETENQGKVNIMGTARPYSQEQASKFDVLVESFPMDGLIGPDLGRLISGRVETLVNPKSNYLDISHGADSDVSLAVTLRNAPKSSLNARGFAFMTSLSIMLADDWFKDPDFENDVRCTVLRKGAAVTLKDLHLEEKSRMSLRGELAIAADRTLSGTLRVGIPRAIIEATGNAKLNDVFGPDDRGLRWISLKISGTGNKPLDDFLELTDDSRPLRRPTAEPEKTPSFEDLTTPE